MTDELVDALNAPGLNPHDADRLSPDARARLLKWYNSNPFDIREGVARKALTILRWCQEYSGVFHYPASMRQSVMIEASESFDVPLKLIADLLVRCNSIIQPSETTRLIAFEGIDGSGKTHQLKLLQRLLMDQQASVTVLSYPDYHEFFGRELASLLSGSGVVRADHLDPKSMALWYALDRKSSVSQICAVPANGFVLLNRYTLSSVVYQSVRSDVDLTDWILQLEHTHLAIPAPDLYIVFDVAPAISQANVSDRQRKTATAPGLDVYEQSIPLLVAARQRYRSLANRLPGVELIECMVDEYSMKAPNVIHSEVVACLRRHRLFPTIPSQMTSRQ
jgi:dTMP kinase